MSPVITTPLRQLQRDLIAAESIPSPRSEDIMVWTSLNLSSGDRNDVQKTIVAAWRRLLCGWLSDRLPVSIETIAHEVLRRISHARTVEWILSDSVIVGTRSPAVIVRAVPGSEAQVVRAVDESVERDWRALATIHAMIDVLDGVVADSTQKAQAQTLANAWSQILRTEFPNYTAGAKDRATERVISLVPPAQPLAEAVHIRTGERPWIPRCDAQHVVDVTREYELVVDRGKVTLQCLEAHPIEAELALFGCGWSEQQLVVWTDRTIRGALHASGRVIAPTPELAGSRRLEFVYPPSVTELRGASSADRRLVLKCLSADVKPVDSSVFFARIPDAHLEQGVVFSPVRPLYRRLLRSAPRRSGAAASTFELDLVGLPGSYALSVAPGRRLPGIAVTPDPAVAPREWRKFRVMGGTDATFLTTAAGGRVLRPALSHDAGITADAVWEIDRDEHENFICLAVETGPDEGGELWIPSNNAATATIGSNRLGVDFGTSHSLVMVAAGSEQPSVMSAEKAVELYRWVTRPTAEDRARAALSAIGGLVPSELCSHKLIPLNGSCCARVEKMFKGDEQRSETRKAFLKELLWHAALQLLTFPRDPAKRLSCDVTFTYPLTSERALREFVQDTKDVCDAIARDYGVDVSRTFIDEASAAGRRIAGDQSASTLWLLADLGGGTLDISARFGTGTPHHLASLLIGGRQLLQRPGFEGVQALIRRAMALDRDAFTTVCRKLDQDADERDHFLENAKATVAVALLASLQAHEGRATRVDVTLLGYGWWFVGFRDAEPQQIRSNVARFARQFEEELRVLVGAGVTANVFVSQDPKRDVAEGALSIPSDAALRRTYGILTVDQDGPSDEELSEVTRRAAFPVGIPCRSQAAGVSWSEVVSPGTQVAISLHDHQTTIDMVGFESSVGRRLTSAGILRARLFPNDPNVEGKVRQWVGDARIPGVVGGRHEYYRGPFQVAIEGRGRHEV